MTKKIKLVIITLISIFIAMGTVNAAGSVSISASSNYIESGNKVTFYIRLNNVAAWDLTGNGYGNTLGCSLGDQGVGDSGTGANISKTLSVTCISNSIGNIALTVKGNVSSANGANIEKTNINTSKTITVTTPREKDSNNYLKSLGVKDYQITPEFNKDTLEYTVEVPSTVNKVTIEGAAASGYASLSGTGEFEVNEGANAFEIKVMSETGVERVYKLTVNVKDDNPIEIKINDNIYTIMKNAKTIEVPSTYESTSIKIKEFEIPAFYSETSKFTLIGVKDTKGMTHLAIYDKENESYKLYNENKSDQLLLYIETLPEIKEGFIKETITINKNSYECLKLNKESNFILVYAMNIVNGSSDYYIYDKEQNTYTLYNDELRASMSEELQKYKTVIIALGGVTIFTILIILILLIRKPKKKKVKKEEIKVNKIETQKSDLSEEKEIENKKDKKQKKKDKTKKIEEKKEIEEMKEKIVEDKSSKKKIKSSEDAMKQVDEATKIIEDFEATMQLNKKDLEQARNEIKDTKEIEATMYDIFSDEKKKKKRK